MMLDDGFETEEDRKKEAEFEHARRMYVETYGVEPGWHAASREDPQVAELCHWFGEKARKSEERLKRLVELNVPEVIIGNEHRLAGSWCYGVYLLAAGDCAAAGLRAWKHMQEAVRFGTKDYTDATGGEIGG